jgi:hypothetical protein
MCSNFDTKFSQYLKNNNIAEQSIKKQEIEVWKIMISGFDVTSQADIKQLAFLAWYFDDMMIELLNQGFFLTKIDLKLMWKFIESKLPIYGPDDQTYEQICGLKFEEKQCQKREIVDLIKFIGQYTDSQFVLNQCVFILS